MSSKLALCLGAVALACLAGCSKEGPGEKAGKEIDAAIEEAREELKDAGEELADAKDEVKKEAKEIAADVKEACEDTKAAVGAKDTDC